MPLDSSIYGNIQQPASLLDQYSKLAQLKALGVTSRLHELQGQAAEQSLAEQQAVRQAGIESGGDTSRLPGLLFGAGAVKPGMEAQAAVIKARQEQAGTEHTQAQTRDITAKHIAGAWSALAKYNGSDEGVRATHDLMAPVVGEQAAQTVTDKLLAMPPEKRLAYSVAQAATNPVGQEALKLYFPETDVQRKNILGTVTETTKARPGLNIPGRTGASAVDTSGTYPPEVQRAGDAILKYDAPPRSTARGSNPMNMAIMDYVRQKDPNYQETEYPTIRKTLDAFSSGGANSPAGKVTALNTSIYHIDSLKKLVPLLENKDYDTFNKLANVYKQRTGQEIIPEFNAVRRIVGQEVTNAVVAGGGGIGEREAAANDISAANSPKALMGVMNKYHELLGGRLLGLEQQYNAGTLGKRGDFRAKYLTPESRAIFEKLKAGGGDTASGARAQPVSPEAQKLIDKYAPGG